MRRRVESMDDEYVGQVGGADCRGLDGRIEKGVGTLRCPGCGQRTKTLYVTPRHLSRCAHCFGRNGAKSPLAAVESAGG